MNNYLKPLKVISAILAIITAGLLTLWALDIIDNETTKETLVKVALVSAIALVLSLVLQLLSGNSKK
jgi:hypothetical protein